MATRKKLVAGIAALSLMIGASVAEEPTGIPEEMDTVLVIGEQPGPGLWKVSKGDHVMWVLASYGPLPRGMTWRARQVEARIAESQEVLYPAAVEVDLGLGLLGMLSLIPSALKAARIPDDKTLKDVLPAVTHDKWSLLRKKYLGSSDRADQMRPMFAIDELRAAAYRKNQLTGGPGVNAIVTAAAKQHKVPVRRLPTVERTIDLKAKDLRDMLKNVRKADFPDIACFTLGLDRLEADIEQLRVRANAWSRGNIDVLRNLHQQPMMGSECDDDFGVMAMAGDGAQAARVKKLEADYNWHEEQAGVQAQLNWIAAARAAIGKNRVTFAVLSVGDVFRSDGHLEALRALGYLVEEPM